MKAVIYVRVSTDEQAVRGYSLPSQIDACRKFANQLDCVVVEEITDDMSGAKLDRPGLNRVRELLRHKEADTLIVYQLDRLSRSLAHLWLLRDELLKTGAQLYFARSGRQAESGSEGAVHDGFEALMAEFERLRILERTTRGRREKAIGGKFVGNGVSPFGYRKVGERDIAALEIVEEEAEVVRLVYKLYVVGDGSGPLGVRPIVSRLTEMKIPSPGDTRNSHIKRRPVGEWNTTMVYKILRDEVYAGTFNTFRYQIVDGRRLKRDRSEWIGVPVPAIVDRELWDSAQERLAKGRALSPRGARHQYLVGRRVVCGCGYTVQGKPAWAKIGKTGQKKLYLFYRCTGKDPHITSRRCDMKDIPVNLLDEMVWSRIAHQLLDPERLRAELERRRATEGQHKAELDLQKAALYEQVADIEARLKRLLDLYLSGRWSGSEEMLDNARLELEDAKARLLKEIEELEGRVGETLTEEKIDSLVTFAERMSKRLENITFEKKRKIIDLLDVRIKVWRENGELQVEMISKLEAVPERLSSMSELS